MTRKIAVSLPDDVAEYLAAQPNTSAAVAEAVRARMNPTRLEQMLSAMGYRITDSGRSTWRDVLAEPLPAGASERARRLRADYRIDS